MNWDSEDSEFTLDLTFEKGDFSQLWPYRIWTEGEVLLLVTDSRRDLHFLITLVSLSIRIDLRQDGSLSVSSLRVEDQYKESVTKENTVKAAQWIAGLTKKSRSY